MCRNVVDLQVVSRLASLDTLVLQVGLHIQCPSCAAAGSSAALIMNGRCSTAAPGAVQLNCATRDGRQQMCTGCFAHRIACQSSENLLAMESMLHAA